MYCLKKKISNHLILCDSPCSAEAMKNWNLESPKQAKMCDEILVCT